MATDFAPDALADLHRSEPGLARAISARVARGSMLLDRVQSDWFRRIDADRLAMETCDRCILGQLHGDYLLGFRAILKPMPSHSPFSAAAHGFALPDEELDFETDEIPDDVMARFAALAAAWRREIRRRLSEAEYDVR